MHCKLGILLLISAYLMPIAVFTAISPIESHLKENGENNTINLVFLGSVDGKGFFADRVPLRNWTEARDYCISSGLHLASITTTDQVNFLQSKKNCTEGRIFCGFYWTGGRINKTDISDFVWDHNNEAVENPGLFYNNTPTSSQCLEYYTGEFGESILNSECGLYTGTLCEALL